MPTVEVKGTEYDAESLKTACEEYIDNGNVGHAYGITVADDGHEDDDVLIIDDRGSNMAYTSADSVISQCDEELVSDYDTDQWSVEEVVDTGRFGLDVVVDEYGDAWFLGPDEGRGLYLGRHHLNSDEVAEILDVMERYS